jgi:hypothetical protein
MVKHIVLWRLKESAHGATREANALHIRTMLEDLNGRIPGLLRLEVGMDFSREDASSDIALYAEFESREALDLYQSHPLHVACKDFVLGAREERRVVDYERP